MDNIACISRKQMQVFKSNFDLKHGANKNKFFFKPNFIESGYFKITHILKKNYRNKIRTSK